MTRRLGPSGFEFFDILFLDAQQVGCELLESFPRRGARGFVFLVPSGILHAGTGIFPVSCPYVRRRPATRDAVLVNSSASAMARLLKR
jgi:hypothetical protein